MPDTVMHAWILSPLRSGYLMPSFTAEIAADNPFAEREGVLAGGFASFSGSSASLLSGQTQTAASIVRPSQGIRPWRTMLLRRCINRAALDEFACTERLRYVKIDAQIPRAARMNGRTSLGISVRKPTTPPAMPPNATTAARTLFRVDVPSFTRSIVVSVCPSLPAVAGALLSGLSVMKDF